MLLCALPNLAIKLDIIWCYNIKFGVNCSVKARIKSQKDFHKFGYKKERPEKELKALDDPIEQGCRQRNVLEIVQHTRRGVWTVSNLTEKHMSFMYSEKEKNWGEIWDENMSIHKCIPCQNNREKLAINF